MKIICKAAHFQKVVGLLSATFCINYLPKHLKIAAVITAEFDTTCLETVIQNKFYQCFLTKDIERRNFEKHVSIVTVSELKKKMCLSIKKLGQLHPSFRLQQFMCYCRVVVSRLVLLCLT